MGVEGIRVGLKAGGAPRGSEPCFDSVALRGELRLVCIGVGGMKGGGAELTESSSQEAGGG